MRTLIKDKKLLRILTAIETCLGYPIHTADISTGARNMMPCGVFLRSDTWEFHKENGIQYSPSTFCHELMHICLWCEGWPVSYRLRSIAENSPEHTMAVMLINTTQHIEVWNRVQALGYNNDVQERVLEVKASLLRCLRDGSLYSGLPPMQRSSLIAASLLGALLAPLPQSLKKTIRMEAQRQFPQAFHLARELENLCMSAAPLSPQSSVEVLESACAKLSLPKGILRHEFPPRSQPDLFQQLLRELK